MKSCRHCDQDLLIAELRAELAELQLTAQGSDDALQVSQRALAALWAWQGTVQETVDEELSAQVRAALGEDTGETESERAGLGCSRCGGRHRRRDCEAE